MSALTTDALRKRWTREEAAQVAELFPADRFELIEGDLINKMGQKPPHAHLIRRLTVLLAAWIGNRVSAQLPITLPEPAGTYSEPEPDIAVLRQDIVGRHPGPADLILVIEISDTTFEFDQNVKARLYASAGIPEYWIIDIPRSRTLIMSQPAGDRYQTVRTVTRDEPLEIEGHAFTLAGILSAVP